MFTHLQIYDPRERCVVGLVDAVLDLTVGLPRLIGHQVAGNPERILLLKLERIGDLLMARPAMSEVRRLAPQARIDLVVGSWNAALARLIPGIDRVLTLDARWLGRSHGGRGMLGLLREAARWRREGYDLGINLEGDIRSNLLLYASGARRRVGFGMAGGGALLTDCLEFQPRRHTALNALRLVEAAFSMTAGTLAVEPPLTASRGDFLAAIRRRTAPLLELPEDVRRAAQERLGLASPSSGPILRDITAPPCLAGINPAGGRLLKQWTPARFAEVASRLHAASGATIVLTGAGEDRAVVEQVRALLPAGVPVLDLSGRLDLLGLAGVLEQLTLFITGDTGPMHLAAAVGTPTVALFGPSDPRRWGPLTSFGLEVRVELPCSPCNRIRKPPARCRDRVPPCLDAIEPEQVVEAARVLLARIGFQPAPPGGSVPREPANRGLDADVS